MGIFHRVVDRLTSLTGEDHEALDDASEPDVEGGVIPIGATVDRERATVQGRVRALTLPTTTSVTALVVEVADPTGTAALVFVGRKSVPGIRCGVTLRARGRVSIKGGRPIIYNPAYEIVPLREQ